MSKRPALDISLRVTAPAGMPAAAVRREVLTRINELTGHYSAFDLRLSDQAEGPKGHLRIGATRLRQKPAVAAARFDAELLALAKIGLSHLELEWLKIINNRPGLSDAAFDRLKKEPVVVKLLADIDAATALIARVEGREG